VNKIAIQKAKTKTLTAHENSKAKTGENCGNSATDMTLETQLNSPIVIP